MPRTAPPRYREPVSSNLPLSNIFCPMSLFIIAPLSIVMSLLNARYRNTYTLFSAGYEIMPSTYAPLTFASAVDKLFMIPCMYPFLSFAGSYVRMFRLFPTDSAEPICVARISASMSCAVTCGIVAVYCPSKSRLPPIIRTWSRDTCAASSYS